VNPFDPRVLARMKNLSLRARSVVDGVMVGIHPSRAKGFSSEFEGHREYAPGDEVGHIDWKAYGKFDRYFIKEYQETTHLRAYLLLDMSGSMAYASDGVSKFEYGATLAASLSYLLLKQQDAVGLILFSHRVERTIPPKAVPGHFWAIIKALENGKPGGETSGGEVLAEVAGTLKRRGMIILISDLLDDPEKVLRGLKQIRSRGSDVLVFQLLDPDELEFPFDKPALFQDMEENLRLAADPQIIRTAYLRTLSDLLKRYEETCAANLIDYHLFPTSTGLDKALTSYLTWRKNLKPR
jgi:uncharacterized protein (DUF58 family)